jgi:hypothetical protein
VALHGWDSSINAKDTPDCGFRQPAQLVAGRVQYAIARSTRKLPWPFGFEIEGRPASPHTRAVRT